MSAEYTIDFTEHISKYTDTFVGRKWVFAEINQWILDNDGPRFFHLTGLPGTGKTAIIARLVQISNSAVPFDWELNRLQPGVVSAYHFCWARDLRWDSPFTFAESISQQLCARYPAYAEALLESNAKHSRPLYIRIEQRAKRAGRQIGIAKIVLDSGDVSSVAAFNRVVREPLEALYNSGFKDQLLILVDALNEALGYEKDIGILSLIAQTDYLPRGVRLLVTSRPDSDVVKELPGTSKTLSLSDSRFVQEREADLRDFVDERWGGRDRLASKLAAGFTWPQLSSRVREKGKDNFLFVRALLEMLLSHKGQVTPRTVSQLPITLDNSYLYILRGIERRSRATWREHLSPLCGTLAVAQEPLTETQLSDFTHDKRPDVRRRLKTLSQLLSIRRGNNKRSDTFALFHESFAELLVNEKRSEEFWCDKKDENSRIADFYTQRYSAHWDSSDDYGLRHVIQHALGSAGNAFATAAGMLTSNFIRAKSARFGSDHRVLGDLKLMFIRAGRTGDIVQQLTWAWIYVGFRDRVAHLAVADLLPIYVRLGKARQALELIDQLDPDDTDPLLGQLFVRRQMAIALADEGYVDDAISIAIGATGVRLDRMALPLLAARIAKREPLKAIELARNQPSSMNCAELCRVLAQKDEQLADAIQLARNQGEVLTDIASIVAERDVQRALRIASSIEPYCQDSSGVSWMRTKDVARANIAISISDSDLARCEALVYRLTDIEERRRAVVGVCAKLAVLNPTRALALLYGVLAGNKRQRDAQHFVAWNLGLAFIVARCDVPHIRSQVEHAWSRQLNQDFVSLSLYEAGAIDLLRRIDLLPLRDDPMAIEILTATVRAIERSVLSRVPARFSATFVSQALGTLVAAIALLDFDGAMHFVERASTRFEATETLRSTMLSSIAKALARIDVTQSLRAIAQIEDFERHTALLEVAQIVARYAPEQALTIIDSVEPRFNRTRSAVIGVIGACVTPNARTIIERLLAKVTPYVESAAFRVPFTRTAMVLSGALAKNSPDLAEQFATRYRDTEIDALSGLYLIDIIQSLATTHLERAKILVQKVARGLPRAEALLSIASAESEWSNKKLSIQAALLELEEDGSFATSQLQRQLATIALEYDPWWAMEISIGISWHRLRRMALQESFRAILQRSGPTVLKDLVRRLYHFLANKREGKKQFVTLAELLSRADQLSVVANLEHLNHNWSRWLKAWVIADLDPDGAIELWAEMGFRDVGQEQVLLRLAKSDPDAVIARLAKRNCKEADHDSEPTAAVFIEIVGSMAKCDIERALDFIENHQWEYDVHATDALAVVARVAAESDWRRGVTIARRISKVGVRRETFLRILEMNSTIACENICEEILADAEAMQKFPADRAQMYEAIVTRLQASTYCDTDLVRQIIRNLALGDRTSFLELLPEIVRLVCRQHPENADQIIRQLDHVTNLLSA